jgi:hypothetical protein
MRSRPGGRWLRFDAVEQFAVEAVAFSWRARFPILPLVPLRVVDGYSAGEGELTARVWGLLPVLRQRGPAVVEGQALRYLAELPWVPHAMLANRQLEWRQLDETAAEVATALTSARAAVRLEFDAGGDLVAASTPARPRLVGRASVRTPWAGAFADFEVVGGVRIPTRGEVRWELPDGLFTYWRATITSLVTE